MMATTSGVPTRPAAPVAAPDSATIAAWIVAHLSVELEVEAASIDVHRPFAHFGLDSVLAVTLAGELGVWLGRPVPPTLAWNFPSIAALARHLAGDSPADTTAAPAAREPCEPIAVVGIACRFPGAASPEAFWRLLRDGVDPITEVPAERWDDAAARGETTGVPRWGGFLPDIDRFDARLFGVSRREADEMDPQQRLLLETTWEAFEAAGEPTARLAGTRTGVFVGIGSNDYIQRRILLADHRETISPYSATGNAHSIAANRLSYVFDLHGPSLALDTACSSSLVAVHLACQSLRSRESDCALAGGVNLVLSPDTTIAFARARMLAPDGRCKTFDAAADGYVRSDGCGVLVLKRLSDAHRDGNPIHAVIRGSAVNQDGRTSGITAPNGNAQQAVIRTALAAAGVQPEEVTYVEAHGTGTPLGDPIELEALAAVLGERAPDARPCLVGSVKASIGHLEVASGVAGLIKVVLCLQHGEIPAQLHFETPNPRIAVEQTRLQIARERTPWPAGEQHRIAGVSSFGFGGTNAHVILEEPPPTAPDRRDVERPLHVLTLSARSRGALSETAASFEEHLAAHPDVPLADLCHGANTRRAHLPVRLAALTDSTERLREQLAAFCEGRPAPGLKHGEIGAAGRPRVAFLFTGQGAQRSGMGRRLYDAQPTFRAALDACAELLGSSLDPPLLALLFEPRHAALLDRTLYTQPALFALEYALAELLETWGVRPDAVLGHSIGEYVAACRAGVFDLGAALALIVERARLMDGLPRTGAMAVVLAGAEQVASVLTRHPEVSIAALNGPRNTTISGLQQAVAAVRAQCAALGMETRSLRVSHALHSPLLAPILDALQAVAERQPARPPSLPLVSNVTGRFHEPGVAPDGAYWRRHAREAVSFAPGIGTLIEHGCTLFVEVGPHPTLIGLGRRCVPEGTAAWLPTLRDGEDEWNTLLSSVAQLHLRGVPVDWTGFDRDHARRTVALPAYPFERARHWHHTAKRRAREATGAAATHPLLGSRLRSALPTVQFESHIGTDRLPYLKDHVVQGTAVFPGAGWVAMALAAAREVFGDGPHALADLTFHVPLPVPEQGAHTVQLSLSPAAAGEATFQIHGARTPDGDEEGAGWTQHASGRVRLSTPTAPRPAPLVLADVMRRCSEEVDAESLYARLAAQGLDYGPSFRAVERVWRGTNEVIGRIAPRPAAAEPDATTDTLHPTVLDAAFHVLAALPAGGSGEGGGYLPVGMKSVCVHARGEGTLWSHAVVRGTDDAHEVAADVRLVDETGAAVAEVHGLRLARLRRGQARDPGAPSWRYGVEWREAPPAPLPAEGAPGEPWLILADAGGVGAALAAALAAARHPSRIFPVPAGTNGHGIVAAPLPELLERPREPGRWKGIVYCRSLDVPAAACEESWSDAVEELTADVLALAQTLAAESAPPRLWLVTRGAHRMAGERAPVAVAHAPLWGLGRVIATEDAALRCTLVDLDPDVDAAAAAAALAAELVADGPESQVALRGGARHVARLRPPTGAGGAEADAAGGLAVPRSASFRLAVARPGQLASLVLRPHVPEAPGPGRVQLEVDCVGLNFRDVMSAMGLYPGAPIPLGAECAGTIVAVGDGVDPRRVGEPVMGVVPASFGRYAVTDAALVVRRPDGLDPERAATMPITFLTAYYALHHIGGLSRGERVLIHAAAGGVGLAAVQLARRAGAEIFATAGSPAKRAFLETLGVRHVMDSRSLEFARQVMEWTEGAGVDLVLNSLPGPFIERGLAVLAPYGRFLEIGRTDIYLNSQIGLFPFRNNLTYRAIDLDCVCREQPDLVRGMLEELLAMYVAGEITPLPLTRFPIREAPNAFRYMAQRKNIGKVVVSLREAADGSGARERLRTDGAYVVTGGLGALGLAVAGWLVERGVRDLVLIGRRPPSGEAASAIGAMERRGARVRVARADVADREQLATVLREVTETCPLRGVVHAAGVLDDGLLAQLDRERLARVLAPKVAGAWNLHLLTRDQDLDIFVLFSSVAALLGSPGQGNYAAANAFLDALAHHRRALGLPAMSIDWGPWAEIGMAARVESGRGPAASGVAPIPPAEALAALGQLIEENPVQAAVLHVDWGRLKRLLRPGGGPSLLADVLPPDTGPSPAAPARDGDGGFLTEMRAVTSEARQMLLEKRLCQELANVLGLEAAEIDVRESISALGLDSLMALELKEQLENKLGIRLPLDAFMESPTLADLVRVMLARLEANPPDRGPALAAG
jgi:acyl transferase domain-containing protein/acyl carrier protein